MGRGRREASEPGVRSPLTAGNAGSGVGSANLKEEQGGSLVTGDTQEKKWQR